MVIERSEGFFEGLALDVMSNARVYLLVFVFKYISVHKHKYKEFFIWFIQWFGDLRVVS